MWNLKFENQIKQKFIKKNCIRFFSKNKKVEETKPEKPIKNRDENVKTILKTKNK